jgi:hypothetical protein
MMTIKFLLNRHDNCELTTTLKQLRTIILLSIILNSNISNAISFKQKQRKYEIPIEYLKECTDIPNFWITSNDDVISYLKATVKKGQMKVIGYSSGGRPIYGVFYGNQREGKGTTTFSGALSYGNISAYRGSNNEKIVYMCMAGVHGAEFEGIVGIVNLISIIETGNDLSGKKWDDISSAISKLDRIILIPIMNPDGRERIPIRMLKYRGRDNTIPEYLNTGGKPDGTITGWPQVKEFIPFDFSSSNFPGGYPNDAGVNIQHDNFFCNRQPETQVLFDLVEKEKPDLILNLHTGGKNFLLCRNFGEKTLEPVFDSLFKKVHTELTINNYQRTNKIDIESNPNRATNFNFNLDTALNLICGALSVIIESPSHAFSGDDLLGKLNYYSPEMLLEQQLICQQEAIKFLIDTGGRSKWTPDRRR